MNPADCTCDGAHTDSVGPEVSNTDILTVIGMESCRAEQRALARILATREGVGR